LLGEPRYFIAREAGAAGESAMARRLAAGMEFNWPESTTSLSQMGNPSRQQAASYEQQGAGE
jgi:hypothetical protein